MRYIFGDCEFDSQLFELRRDGELVSATKQTLAILAMLLENPDRLITKDELVEHIWGGRAITDAAITVRLYALRKAIGDSGTAQQLLKTVRGLGVRFVADVTRDGLPPAGLQMVPVADRAPAVAPPAHSPAQSSDKSPDQPPVRTIPPKVAILPFAYMGADSPHKFLHHALPDEIITALSRLRSLTVIARGSSFQIPSFSAQPDEVRARMGADYCTSGQLEITGNTMFLSIELAETQSGNILWRDRIVIDVKGVHEVRTDIVQRVAREVDQYIARNELLNARIQSPGSLNAWQNFHSGFSLLFNPRAPKIASAMDHFRSSIAQDPNFARAHAGLAHASLSRLVFDYDFAQAPKLIQTVAKSASDALRLDPGDPLALIAASRREVAFNMNFDLAIDYLKRAVDCSPSEHLAHNDLARLYGLAGDLAAADHHLAQTEQLHPANQAPIQLLMTKIQVALGREDREAALEYATKLQNLGFHSASSRLTNIAAFHCAGHHEEAAALAKISKQVSPEAGMQNVFYRLPGMSEQLQNVFQEALTAYGIDSTELFSEDN